MSSTKAPGAAPPDELEQQWTAAWQRAHAVWPAIAVTQQRFVEFVRARLPADQDPATVLATMHLDDLLLACGCINGDPAALAAFDGLLEGARRVLGRSGLAPDQVDDVLQRVRYVLLVRRPEDEPRLVRYVGTGPLSGWVRVAAAREAGHARRKIGRDAARDVADIREAIILDVETAYLKQHYLREFSEGFTEALRSLSAREQNMLRMHVVEKLSVDQLAAVFRVHRTTVWRWMTEVHRKLLEGTREILAQRLGIVDKDLDTILRLIQSQLVLSLDDVLSPRE